MAVNALVLGFAADPPWPIRRDCSPGEPLTDHWNVTVRELKPRSLTKYQRFEADAIEFRKYPAALEVGIYPVSSLSYDLFFGL